MPNQMWRCSSICSYIDFEHKPSVFCVEIDGHDNEVGRTLLVAETVFFSVKVTESYTPWCLFLDIYIFKPKNEKGDTVSELHMGPKR